MIPSPDRGPGSRNGRFVTAALLIVCLGALVAAIFAAAATMRLEASAREVVRHTLASVRLAARLQRDEKDRRVLVGEHISAADPGEKARILAEVRTLEARIASAVAVFESQGSAPHERAAWNQTRANLAKLDEPIGAALAFSDQSRGAEAHRVMRQLASEFTSVDRDLERFIDVDDRAATASLRRSSIIRLWLVASLVGIGFATAMGTFAIGRWSAARPHR
jgi:hypothetical protein